MRVRRACRAAAKGAWFPPRAIGRHRSTRRPSLPATLAGPPRHPARPPQSTDGGRGGQSRFCFLHRKEPAMTAPDILAQISDAFAARAAASRPCVVALEPECGPPASGILWRKDLVVASDQALPRAPGAIRVPLPDGGFVAATLLGRDPGTNV